MEEIVELLKKEYHGGAGIKSDNGEFSVWYAEDGIHLAKGRSARCSRTAQVISWEAAAERIGELMDAVQYATNVELAGTQEYDERYAKWSIADLPIIPDRWKYNVSESTKEQFRLLKGLMADGRVSTVICATDAGREGELIFRLVYMKAG